MKEIACPNTECGSINYTMEEWDLLADNIQEQGWFKCNVCGMRWKENESNI